MVLASVSLESKGCVMGTSRIRRCVVGAGLALAIVAAPSMVSAQGAASARGVASNSAFVIGDGSAVSGLPVQFWGAQWSQNNLLSGGSAPDSFKGYADVVVSDPNSDCSGTFTTWPGNSSEPPATISSPIDVLVVTSVTKSGPVISGTYVDILEVVPNPGYEADPGHAGIGVVIGSACDANGGGGGGGFPT
jgi:hypothetical protein